MIILERVLQDLLIHYLVQLGRLGWWVLGGFTGGLNGVLVPVINSSESLYGFDLNANTSDYERPPKIFKYNPRILYYDGYVTNPNSTNMATYFNLYNPAGSPNGVSQTHPRQHL